MTSIKINPVPATAGTRLPIPCVGCHAMYYDTATADVFDQLQEQSRQQYREQCTAVSPDAKPCMQPSVVTLAKSADKLAFRAVDAIGHLRYAMQAYEGLEYMVSCAADHAMPQPEKLGAIIRASNEAVNSRLETLDAALAELRTILKAAQPSQGRV
ncbi:hypothetical protein [Comamonas odontotermitis]|uniref:hypothetical protein n=1 Tax=Comamonas odontotermitis TaxID=379895 RepID=UPI00375380AB